MTDVSVVGPENGEAIHLGPTRMRILEDGHSTGHRLGVGEITLALHTEGPPQHRHAQHDEGFCVVSSASTPPRSPRPRRPSPRVTGPPSPLTPERR